MLLHRNSTRLLQRAAPQSPTLLLSHFHPRSNQYLCSNGVLNTGKERTHSIRSLITSTPSSIYKSNILYNSLPPLTPNFHTSLPYKSIHRTATQQRTYTSPSTSKSTSLSGNTSYYLQPIHQQATLYNVECRRLHSTLSLSRSLHTIHHAFPLTYGSKQQREHEQTPDKNKNGNSISEEPQRDESRGTRIIWGSAALSAVGVAVYLISQHSPSAPPAPNNNKNDEDGEGGLWSWLSASTHSVIDSIPHEIDIWGHVFPRSIFILLLANTAVFVAWQIPGLQLIMYKHFTCSLHNVFRERRYYTLITSAFSHASFMHFAFNMLAFYTISSSLLIPHRALYGRSLMTEGEFLTLYFTSAVASQLIGWVLQMIFTRGHVRIKNMSIPGLGASGVVCSVFAISATLFPTSQYYVFLIPYPIYASTLLPALAVFDFIGMIFSAYRFSPLAHHVHLGGIIYGLMVCYWYIKPKVRQRLMEDNKRMEERALETGRRWW